MEAQPLADDLRDRKTRGERAEGVLEDDLEALPHSAQVTAGEGIQAGVAEADLAVTLSEAQQRQGQGGLAGARLADDAQGLAGGQGQLQGPDRLEGRRALHEEDRKSTTSELQS